MGSANGSKTHCPRNHPYDEANTRRANGQRFCRRCMADRHAELMSARKLLKVQLDEKQIARLRSDAAEGVPRYLLAKRFGIPPEQVSALLRKEAA